MNALQQFISEHPFGFIQAGVDTEKLIAIHRLCQVLVRCGACRFVCAVQDLERLINCIEAGGEYVRDVAITVNEIENAHIWALEYIWKETKPINRPNPKPVHNHRYYEPFNEADCSGVFDGFSVSSDADPGL